MRAYMFSAVLPGADIAADGRFAPPGAAIRNLGVMELVGQWPTRRHHPSLVAASAHISRPRENGPHSPSGTSPCLAARG
jgi:hypothetical protein